MKLRRRLAGVRRLLDDLVTVAVGRRADGQRRSLARSIRDLRIYVAGRRASTSGRTARAADLATALLRVHPDLRWALGMVGSASSRGGELTASLVAVQRLRTLGDTAALRRREQELQARLEDTEPGWLPSIPGPERPVEPRASNVVMHLLKWSLPDRQSGYTIRSRETLRAQRDAGLEPFVVTPFGYPADRPDPVPEVELVDGITHHRLAPGAPTETLTPGELLTQTATLAAEVAYRERPAIIQAASGFRGYENALVGLALREHLRRPLVYEVRGFLETTWTRDLAIAETAELTRRRYATEARAMAGADAVTTLSVAMRDELVARGVPTEKIVIVPNGIDPAAFQPTEADPDLRRRYGLDDRWVFGYVSSMDSIREGHQLLIEATARLVASGRPVTCLLVGDGTLRPQLEAQAAAAGVRGSVVFAGRVAYEEVRAHYALFDAFVVPREPDRAARFVTPLKPYEAMAMGLPLVVSDLPALTEIAAPDERGLAFRASDAGALVAALERLIDQPQLGPRLGSTGRAWVLAERTWAADGARYRDVYQSVLERFDPASALTAPLNEPTAAAATSR